MGVQRTVIMCGTMSYMRLGCDIYIYKLGSVLSAEKGITWIWEGTLFKYVFH